MCELTITTVLKQSETFKTREDPHPLVLFCPFKLVCFKKETTLWSGIIQGLCLNNFHFSLIHVRRLTKLHGKHKLHAFKFPPRLSVFLLKLFWKELL